MILHSKELIEEYTVKGYWGTRTLLDLFYKNCEAHPERMAVEDPPDRIELVGTPPKSLTYAQFKQAVEAMADELLRRGLNKDEVVVVQLPNIWELAALYLAIALAGGIISPLPWQWREKDVGYVLKLTGARFYIAPEWFKGFGYLKMGSELGFKHVISLDEIGGVIKRRPAFNFPAQIQIDANEVFTICWTSGTEANPKGCPLTHNNWLFGGNLVLRTCKLQKGDRILCVAPLVNMTGVGVNYVPWLLTGGTLVLHHPLNMQVLLQQLTNSNVHFTILVPAVLNMIIKLPVENSPDLSSIRTIATGSAPPSSWAMIEFKKRWGIEIINIWGQNEGTGLVAGPDDVPDLDMRSDYFPFWGKEGCSWPSGVEGIQIKILGENGQEVVAPEEVGELCYRSPFTFPGYFRRPDLTERSFTKDGYFRTGDLFILHDSCHVGFYDRKKDIVIRGGFNISSAEVENIVLGHPKVAEAAVVPMPDEVLGERVCLFVVPSTTTLSWR